MFNQVLNLLDLLHGTLPVQQQDLTRKLSPGGGGGLVVVGGLNPNTALASHESRHGSRGYEHTRIRYWYSKSDAFM